MTMGGKDSVDIIVSIIGVRPGFSLLETCEVWKGGSTKSNDGIFERGVSQLCYGPVVTYCMVYHYIKRVTLARLLANEGPAIYVVYLNRYFIIPP